MAIKPINLALENKKSNQQNSAAVAFKGGFPNPIVATMDAMERGGFAAGFVTQDMLGMAVPRMAAGLTRNEDKTGKKNWAYARLIAIRELLSGPSTFIIPMVMIYGIKKCFGRANNVPIEFIKAMSGDLDKFAASKPGAIDALTAATTAEQKAIQGANLKAAYYRHAAENLISTSTDNMLTGKALEDEVNKFTNKLIELENAPKSAKYTKVPGQTELKFGVFKVAKKEVAVKSQKMLTSELVNDFVVIRKKYSNNPSNHVFKAWFTDVEGKNGIQSHLSTSIKNFVDHLTDYSNDFTKSLAKKFKPGKQTVGEFIKSFCEKRVGSRVLTNLSMTSAVIAFFVFIPKLYKSKDGKNPALEGLVPQEKKAGVNNENK